MNIFELTEILNEAKGRRKLPITNKIATNTNILDNVAQDTRDAESIENTNQFLNKINNLLQKKIESLDSNSGYSQLLERLKSFYGGSNVNNNTVLDEILSLLTPEMISIINSTTPDALYKYENLGSIFEYKSHGRDGSNKVKKEFLDRLSKFRPSYCGPFEVLLCLLFNGTKLQKAGRNKGDIVIGGTVYEVKRDGGGCIDTGLDQIELMMKKAQGNELRQLTQRFEKAQKLFKVLDANGSKLMEDYAKKLNAKNVQRMEQNFTNTMAQNQNLDTQDVQDYFSLLSDDDKKRAVLYGFYMLGYHNIIICKNDAACSYKVITSKDIVKILKHQSSMEQMGFTIILSSNAVLDETEVRAKSANFGSYIIKMTK